MMKTGSFVSIIIRSNLAMSSLKTMTDVAYDLLSKKKRAVPFTKLWDDVCKVYGADDDLIVQFYSDMIMDSRFVSLKDNKWDLAQRRKFDESHIDISELELDDEDEEQEEEDDDQESYGSDPDEY